MCDYVVSDYEIEITYEDSESYLVKIGKSPHRILVNGRLTRHSNGLELKCEMFDTIFSATVVILDDLHLHLFTKVITLFQKLLYAVVINIFK